MGDSAGEYVELYNSGTSAVDIAGWELRDDDSDSFVISTGGAVVVDLLLVDMAVEVEADIGMAQELGTEGFATAHIVAVVDGGEASEDTILTEGQVLNFVKPSGEKGAA